MSNPNFGVWRPMAESVEFNALESNSNAVTAVADTVRTTLGPKGLDKLLIDQAMNRHVSNDGVTILLSLRAIHPVARMIVEIAERQEQLVGDGTTTAVVMAAEMIKEGKRLVKELGVHPTKVVEGIDSGVKHACDLLRQETRSISISDLELEQVIRTSLASKLDGLKLSKLVISALRTVGDNARYHNQYDFDKSIMVIRRINMEDSVVNGIVLERKKIDPEMPTEVKEAKILIVKMDLKPVKESWLKEGSKYDEILSMEKDRVSKSKEIVDKIVSTGANTILIASTEVDQVIEDLLVAKKIFAVRISTEEIEYVTRYTKAKPIRMIEELTSTENLESSSGEQLLGYADAVREDEENAVVYIENGAGKNIVTMIVSGSTKETSLERWRAAIDGVNAAEAALNEGVVAGGGSAELHVVDKVKKLRLKGLEQVGLEVVVSALESIMRQILTNAGYNGLEKVMAAKASPSGFGIDLDSGEPVDMWKRGILDPLKVKTMALEAAAEISKSVLRIDRNLAAEDLSPQSLSDSKR
ncbi:MAG TPA: TCP-1/cpn60 chaperonin family protein [Nitrososphaeraceae archaeon]|nr:TCP-1/cpn60 chaperonin family protein [Nitrososphaeraceae archaeon]